MPFINSMKGNSGAHYNWLGKGQLNDLMCKYIILASYLLYGCKVHNLVLKHDPSVAEWKTIDMCMKCHRDA